MYIFILFRCSEASLSCSNLVDCAAHSSLILLYLVIGYRWASVCSTIASATSLSFDVSKKPSEPSQYLACSSHMCALVFVYCVLEGDKMIVIRLGLPQHSDPVYITAIA